MRATTLWQPWASLVSIGAKRYETRGYPPPAKLIGQRIAIHAAKKSPFWVAQYLPADTRDAVADALDLGIEGEGWDGLPRGAVVCTAVLAGAYKVASIVDDDAGGTMALFDLTATVKGSPFSSVIDVDEFGDYTPGRWAWLLAEVQALPEPAPAKGKQGWWEWEADHG